MTKNANPTSKKPPNATTANPTNTTNNATTTSTTSKSDNAPSKNDPNDPTLRILKSGTCPSLSGKSKLSYEFAAGPTSDLQVRIARNTGGGYFSDHWVKWERLQGVLDKNGAKPITCHTLGPLFKGQSVNTPGFLLAVLKHEGLVQPSEEQPRCYERTDPSAFYADLKVLQGAPAKAVKPVKAVATPKKTRPAKQ